MALAPCALGKHQRRQTGAVLSGMKQPMSKWRIRRATANDAETYSECIDAAYSAYANRISDLPAVSDGIADDINDHIVWVAEADQNIVAGIVLIPCDDTLLVANIAVHPDASGNGLGRVLMELAETEAAALELDELSLSTHVDIPENISLYEHLGWQETARTGNKVKMRKRL